MFSIAGPARGGGSEARGAGFVGSSLCGRHAPGTGSGGPGWLPRAVPTWGTARWHNPGHLTKRTLPLPLPHSLPLLGPEIFLFLNRAPSSRLPVEECSPPGPSHTHLSAWHRLRSAGTSLRIPLSWANTASPALQIPVSPSPALPAEPCKSGGGHKVTLK